MQKISGTCIKSEYRVLKSRSKGTPHCREMGLHNEWTWVEVEEATTPPAGTYANSHGGDAHGSGWSP